MEHNDLAPIPRQTLSRLPEYLSYLKSDACADIEYISAGRLAEALGRSEIQVRKDLSAVSSVGGKPKLGFERLLLFEDISHVLGLNNVDSAVLLGAGNLGAALLRHQGFRGCGVEIVAAFDNDPAKVGQEINGVQVLSSSTLSSLCKRLHVHIGILAVSAATAQEAAEQMVDAGLLAIWNFAPLHLRLPEPILVRNEDLASSLTLLSHQLAQRLKEQK